MTKHPPPAAPDPFGTRRAGRRLRRAVEPHLDDGEAVVAWTRAWVSRDGRAQWLAVRHRDYVVLTDRALRCWSAAFLSRRPRRQVLLDRLDRCVVESVGRHPDRSVRVRTFARRPLRFDLPRRGGAAFARLLASLAADVRAGDGPGAPARPAPGTGGPQGTAHDARDEGEEVRWPV